MNAALFGRELNRGQALQQSLDRYLYVLMSQQQHAAHRPGV